MDLQKLVFQASGAEARAMVIIQQHSDSEGYCYATNAEMGEKMGVSGGYFSRLVTQLHRKGLLALAYKKQRGYVGTVRVIKII